MIETKTEGFSTHSVRLADLARALSHPARIEILALLGRRQECICGDLVDELPLAQASVSRHLKTLKEAGLIKGTVDGPRSCYCLNHDAVATARAAFGQYFDRIDAEPVGDASCC